MEQPVEVLMCLPGMCDSVEPLDEIPQCVGIEYEARTRHDVRPVAGLVLLQQPESLMLLRQQPLNGKSDALRVPPPQSACASSTIQERQGNQPPQRRIDASEIPEVRLLPLRIDELRDLSVRRLMFCQGVQTRCGCMLQILVARQCHPDRTHGCVAPEYGGVAAFAGAGSGRCREDAVGSQIPLQQFNGARPAGCEQRLFFQECQEERIS